MPEVENTRSNDLGREDTRPRIAHLIDSIDVSGGAERQLVANLNTFDHSSMRHDLVLLKTSQMSRAGEVPSSVRVWVLDGARRRWGRLGAAIDLYALARREGFDLIHASLPDSALAARLVGLIAGIPVVESLVNISHEDVRTVDNPRVTRTKLTLHRWLDRITMFRVTAFHAVSEAVADSWTRIVGIRRQRITVIPRGIDRTTFASPDAEARGRSRREVIDEFSLPEDVFLVVSVGRQEPQKGHRYLIEAVHELRERVPQLRVLVAGRTGLATPRLEAAIDRLRLQDRVLLVGPRTDLPRLLAAADVFAFPSLFEGNGGNAMIEAMSAGLAIVTTAAAPMTDLVPDESVGLLVPRSDSGTLAAALEKLHRDPDLRARLGRRARERAEGFPTPGEIAHRYEHWYTALLEGRTRVRT